MPDALKNIESVAAIITGDNIDTDQIIPSREITSTGRDGLRDGLFANQRYLDLETRRPDPDFPLNRPPFDSAKILISGKNFGCGSSREHAVWALHEFGIRAIIAESFGEIFHANCINNSIAPIVLNKNDLLGLQSVLREAASQVLRIDIERQLITSSDLPAIAFELNPTDQSRLTGGLDLIDLTNTNKDDIEAFIARDKTQRPWVYEI